MSISVSVSTSALSAASPWDLELALNQVHVGLRVVRSKVTMALTVEPVIGDLGVSRVQVLLLSAHGTDPIESTNEVGDGHVADGPNGDQLALHVVWAEVLHELLEPSGNIVLDPMRVSLDRLAIGLESRRIVVRSLIELIFNDPLVVLPLWPIECHNVVLVELVEHIHISLGIELIGRVEARSHGQHLVCVVLVERVFQVGQRPEDLRGSL